LYPQRLRWPRFAKESQKPLLIGFYADDEGRDIARQNPPPAARCEPTN
jgi:hypothetical protein